VSPSDWDRLTVTFGKFKGLPTSKTAAESAGWTAFGTCAQGYNFNRYILGDDLGALLLFDNLGNIAGYAIGTTNENPVNRPDVWTKETLNGKTFNTLAFYFQDPTTVCKRTAGVNNQLTLSKVGDVTADRVWMQAGKNFLPLPLSQALADKTAGFVKGGCFFTMGVHYWYNVSTAQACTDFFPLFALYNRGQLNGFGIGQWNYNDPSPRNEHPGGSVLKVFFDNNIPTCLLGSEPISTQHVYLTQPLKDFC